MGKLMSLIYFYIVSVIGLVLLIIGLYNAISYGVNTSQYDEYPLKYVGNENCDYMGSMDVSATSVPVKNDTIIVDKNIQKQQKKDCELRVKRERKQTQVDDLKNTIYFTLIGALLLAIHLPIALRKSSEEKK